MTLTLQCMNGMICWLLRKLGRKFGEMFFRGRIFSPRKIFILCVFLFVNLILYNRVWNKENAVRNQNDMERTQRNLYAHNPKVSIGANTFVTRRKGQQQKLKHRLGGYISRVNMNKENNGLTRSRKKTTYSMQGHTIISLRSSNNLPVTKNIMSSDVPSISNYSREWRVQSLPETVEELKFYRPQPKVVNHFDPTFLINGSNICGPETSVVMIIHSNPAQVNHRRAIRRTWGTIALGLPWPGLAEQTKLMNVRLAFIFGVSKNWTNAIREENKLFGDVVQGDFEDAYHNMTSKAILGMSWVTKYCKGVRYVIKSDDDVMVNLPHLLHVLDSMASRNKDGILKRTIVGPVIKHAPAQRKGKWAVSKNAFPFKNLPTYCAGALYVYSRDTLDLLLGVARYVPHIYIDDVFITGVLARVLRLYHAHMPGFGLYGQDLHGCVQSSVECLACNIFLNKSLSIHQVFGLTMVNLWYHLHHLNMKKCKIIYSKQEKLREQERLKEMELEKLRKSLDSSSTSTVALTTYSVAPNNEELVTQVSVPNPG